MGDLGWRFFRTQPWDLLLFCPVELPDRCHDLVQIFRDCFHDSQLLWFQKMPPSHLELCCIWELPWKSCASIFKSFRRSVIEFFKIYEVPKKIEIEVIQITGGKIESLGWRFNECATNATSESLNRYIKIVFDPNEQSVTLITKLITKLEWNKFKQSSVHILITGNNIRPP